MASGDRRGGTRQLLSTLTVNVPGVRIARSYERRWLPRDLLAGLALAALLVPEGMSESGARRPRGGSRNSGGTIPRTPPQRPVG